MKLLMNNNQQIFKYMKNNKQWIIILILFVLLLLPNLCALYFSSDLYGQLVKRIAYIALSIGLILLPALFLRAKTYFILLGLLSFIFVPIDITSLYLNHQPASSLFVYTILMTDWHEACELLKSVWPLTILVVLLYGIYIYLVVKLENRYLFGKKVRYGLITIVLGMLIMLYGSMCVLTYQLGNNKTYREVLAGGCRKTLRKFNKIYPCNIYVAFQEYIARQKELKSSQQNIQDFTFGITPVKDSTLVIFYIGETARYDHFQINGYNRPTTPKLCTCSNIVSYSHVYSLANLTLNALPTLLTRAAPTDMSVLYNEKSIVEAFAEAGYKTAYISSNCDDTYMIRIMNTCEYHYLFPKTFDAENSYDAALLPHVKAAYNQQCRMVLVHSLGSHFKYSMRYPKEDEYFTPAFGAQEAYVNINQEHKEFLINAYDNSIRYTDKCLGELIDWVDSLDVPAVILYVSDHGESFWDDEHNFVLHGSYVPTEAEYHVPFVVWYSNEYKATHIEQCEAIETNKDKMCASNVVFSSLLDMIGVKESVDSSMSICSPFLQQNDTLEVLNGKGEIVKFGIQ